MNPANTNKPNSENTKNDITDQIKNLTLNTKAADYVPNKKKEEKIQFNLEAQEYKPKPNTQTDYENPFSIKTADEEDGSLC